MIALGRKKTARTILGDTTPGAVYGIGTIAMNGTETCAVGPIDTSYGTNVEHGVTAAPPIRKQKKNVKSSAVVVVLTFHASP